MTSMTMNKPATENRLLKGGILILFLLFGSLNLAKAQQTAALSNIQKQSIKAINNSLGIYFNNEHAVLMFDIDFRKQVKRVFIERSSNGVFFQQLETLKLKQDEPRNHKWVDQKITSKTILLQTKG